VIATAALALALLTGPAPADGVRLAPDPSPAASAPAGAPTAPGAPAGLPLSAAAGGIAGLAALAALRRPERQPKEGEATPLVVFVSGHGNGSPTGLFSQLVSLMGLERGQARYYDYRWADGGPDHRHASEDASIDETAGALDGYLAGLSDSGRPIYLVGFSKGGTGIAELVARWDRRGPEAAHGVIGAALLDPPLASGVHGWLQSVGAFWGPIPDDGGYDPIHCDRRGCVDTRRHLGEASGVEVVVMRNPRGGITNFGDLPEGLRVYDASDGGPGFAETLFTRPWDLVSRATNAHLAVLDDPRVADCLSAEIAGSGACHLPVPGQHPPAGLIAHGPAGGLKVALNKMM
jgi:hypothetical protein